MDALMYVYSYVTPKGLIAVTQNDAYYFIRYNLSGTKDNLK